MCLETGFTCEQEHLRFINMITAMGSGWSSGSVSRHNKSIMEMIQSNKKPIKIPTNIEELTTIVKGFGGLATILFGKNSSLPTSLIQLTRDLSANKFILKFDYARHKDGRVGKAKATCYWNNNKFNL